MDEIRYKITPQMKDYDNLERVWLPFLMYFHMPNYVSSSVNTDSRGFRISYKGGNKVAPFASIDNLSLCLLVGASLVFGTGATSDKNTISSRLNSMGEETWFNLSGKAYNSTQELMLFLFTYQRLRNIKKIVMISGMSNLILYYLSPCYLKELGSFFGWDVYYEKMNAVFSAKKTTLLRKALNCILNKKAACPDSYDKGIMRYMLGKSGQNPPGLECGWNPLQPGIQDKEDLLYVLKRDLSIWKILAHSLGIEIYYVLHPYIRWIDKELSKEEETLFNHMDNLRQPQPISKILKEHMGHEQYKWYSGKIKGICESNNIRFFDLNEAISKKQAHKKWLFVDRVHCTDEGYDLIARILKEEVLK